VNDSGEATHYQIELTSRQVLAALVVLLICVFAAFFAGVWIGRNAEADSAANELARVDEVARGGERFDFFSKTDAPSAAGGGATQASPEQPEPNGADFPAAGSGAALEPGDFGPDADDAELGIEGDQSAMSGADPDALFEDEETDGELAPPEEMGRGGRRRRAAERAAEEARVTAEDAAPAAAGDATRGNSQAATDPVPAPTAVAPASGAAAATESGFHIQVLATSDRAKADALVARLVDADFKAFVVPSNEGGRTMYRVRVGPFDDRAIAAGKAQELESRWGLDSWISPGTP
jgi:cell division septation protein DedD